MYHSRLSYTVTESRTPQKINDQALDYRTSFVSSAFSTTKDGLNPAKEAAAFEHHKTYLMPKYVRGIEKHLAESPYGGPYTLGAEITCELRHSLVPLSLSLADQAEQHRRRLCPVPNLPR